MPGLGVEIGLAVDDVDALFEHVNAEAPHTISEGLVSQPCGLSDFRVADPDGYYLRIQESMD